MAKRARAPRLEKHEEFKERSGWYLAAWRDFRGLSLEELAEEVGTSKGQISDLETGAEKKGTKQNARYNRDWVESLARALDTTPGFLIDVNPYRVDDAFTAVTNMHRDLAKIWQKKAVS